MAVKRLDKILSDHKIASRSQLKDIIRSGRVRVDGNVITNPDARIDTDSALITFDGIAISQSAHKYYMMNKPEGYICATEDRSQDTVLDLLPKELRRYELFPVGRLDKDTSGLLLLTNDGGFAHKIISPRSNIAKLYHAKTDGQVNEDDVKAFKDGISLADGTLCLPAELTVLEDCCCYVKISEGKYHQVKRMLASRGKPVLKLKRLAIGSLYLDESLKSGDIAELSENDLCKVISENN